MPAGQVMPVPAGVDLVDAAALPEVACTVWSNVFMVAGLRPGERFLVHGGAGGIGTFAIQLAAALRRQGLHDRRHAGEARAVRRARAPSVTINYRDEDFVEVVKERSDGPAPTSSSTTWAPTYLGRNVAALATEGRLVIIGMQGGTKGELDLSTLLRKRAP